MILTCTVLTKLFTDEQGPTQARVSPMCAHSLADWAKESRLGTEGGLLVPELELGMQLLLLGVQAWCTWLLELLSQLSLPPSSGAVSTPTVAGTSCAVASPAVLCASAQPLVSLPTVPSLSCMSEQSPWQEKDK